MAAKTIVTEKPVVLEGYQAVMKPSKFGYSLATVFTDDLIEQLEADRTEVLKWCESKLKNPKRATLKPEPWEEVSDVSTKSSSRGMRRTAPQLSIVRARSSTTQHFPFTAEVL